MKIKLICEQCGKEFFGYKGKKFCSRPCINNSQKKSKAIFYCLNCGKMVVADRHTTRQKFCSINCAGMYRRNKDVVKICEWCKKEYVVKGKTAIERRRFCSNKCANKWISTYTPMDYSSYWTEERRKEQGIKLSKMNLEPEYNKKLRKRMHETNPGANKEVQEKIKETQRLNGTLGFTGKYSKNRGGNGKFSPAEELCYDFLLSLGFQYNSAIKTNSIRKKYPDMHIGINYKPDFTHLIYKLCIELDGKTHDGNIQQQRDRKKEFVLKELGYRVIRYSNEFVLNNFDSFRRDIILQLGYKISKVVSINEVSSQKYMYDLEIQNNHNYFANNILVHNCKNLESAQATGMLKLDKSLSKMLMTGTLLVNNPYDLYCPMSLCGLINYNKWQFERKFVIKDDWNNLVGYKNMDELHDILYKSSIRRTKDLLTLPDKIYKQEWIEFSKEEQNVFDQVTGNAPFALEKIEQPLDLMAVITRMRQTTVAAELLTSKVKKSTKFDRLKDILDEAKFNNEKVLVFCPFTQALELGLEYCKEYKPKLVKGGMGTKVQEVVDEHENTNGFSVLFAQEATLGVGYTLINTSIVVFLSPPWNRANYDQCSDRCHRIGQKHTVQIIDLLIKDTYDELIYRKLHGKGAMSDMLIDGKEDEVIKQYLRDADISFIKKDIPNLSSSLFDKLKQK